MHARAQSLSRLSGFLVALLLAAPVALRPLAAQEPAQPKVETLPPASVDVVRIEVVATEKRRAKPGLRREDFEVLEDGKPQPIVQFQAFSRPVPATATATPAPPVAAEEEEKEDLLPARYVVLAIDDVHMSFESLVRTQKALERFINQDLAPEDQVALVIDERRPRALAGVHDRPRRAAPDALASVGPGKARGLDGRALPERVPVRADRGRGSDGARRRRPGDPGVRDRAGPDRGRVDRATEGARDHGGGHLQLAAGARDAREPVPRPVRRLGTQGRVLPVGRLPDRDGHQPRLRLRRPPHRRRRHARGGGDVLDRHPRPDRERARRERRERQRASSRRRSARSRRCGTAARRRRATR